MQYYFEKIPTTASSIIELDQEEGFHLARVKRCRVNEKILLFDGYGTQAASIVREVRKSSVSLEIIETKFTPPSVQKTVLLVVPPKGKNFSLLLEKATEIGIDEIVPVVADFAAKEYQAEKKEKYEKILFEASKQCERAYLPKLHTLMSLEKSLESFSQTGDLQLFFHTRGGKRFQNLNFAKGQTFRYCFWVGPEGGWSESEIALVHSKNIQICTLSTPILRVETAVIAITILVQTAIS